VGTVRERSGNGPKRAPKGPKRESEKESGVVCDRHKKSRQDFGVSRASVDKSQGSKHTGGRISVGGWGPLIGSTGAGVNTVYGLVNLGHVMTRGWVHLGRVVA